MEHHTSVRTGVHRSEGAVGHDRLRRVCVFTGTRAEYGQLYWLLRALDEHPSIALQLLVSGAHLADSHGRTVEEIRRDGFAIDEQVHMLLAADTPIATVKSMGVAAIGLADALHRLRPNALVVLGDRYEALVAAESALVMGVPVAHLHGGERTEGAFDDAIRHAITKLSYLHFAATAEFRARIIQMGEEPDRVFNVGALSVESVQRTRVLSRAELEGALGYQLRATSFLVTYHPATMGTLPPARAIQALIGALDMFPDASITFTAPNADPGADAVLRAVEAYAAGHPERVHLHTSLGRALYVNTLRAVDVVIGNSSSGIVEAPAVHTPTVNIGDRQAGRPRAASVIDCSEKVDDITAAITKALEPGFRASMSRDAGPYEGEDTAARIAEALATSALACGGRKAFFDL